GRALAPKPRRSGAITRGGRASSGVTCVHSRQGCGKPWSRGTAGPRPAVGPLGSVPLGGARGRVCSAPRRAGGRAAGGGGRGGAVGGEGRSGGGHGWTLIW